MAGLLGATETMLRTLNRYLLIGSAITLAVTFWNRNAIPADIAFQPPLEKEPRQRPIEQEPFSVTYAGIEYRVEPKYDYELFGLVVSYRRHDGESLMHRLSHDRLNMADVCVVWSDTAFSQYLRKLHFWNGVFTCNVETSDRVAWSHFKMNQLSNNHLISDDPFIRDRVDGIRVGDQIRVAGWLSSYGALDDNGHTAGMRGTSTTRDDTGDGACETIYVKDFEIIEPASSGWRLGMYFSLAVLVAAIAIHFALPYRPYRE